MKARFLYRNCKARWRDQRQEIKALLAASKSGDTLVDVGANKGSYLFWMSRVVGPTGRVYAFEPQTALAAYLCRAVDAWRLRNVTINEKAVSDHSGDRTLYLPEPNSPGASLEEAVRSRTACEQLKIATVSLDDFFHDYQGRIAAIKVDVEGHELAVFRGARQLLLQHAPVLIFEAENRHLSRGTVFDVLDYLRTIGYDGSFVSGNTLIPIKKFDPALHQREDGERFWDSSAYCNNFIMHRLPA